MQAVKITSYIFKTFQYFLCFCANGVLGVQHWPLCLHQVTLSFWGVRRKIISCWATVMGPTGWSMTPVGGWPTPNRTLRLPMQWTCCRTPKSRLYLNRQNPPLVNINVNITWFQWVTFQMLLMQEDNQLIVHHPGGWRRGAVRFRRRSRGCFQHVSAQGYQHEEDLQYRSCCNQEEVLVHPNKTPSGERTNKPLKYFFLQC